MKAATAVTVFVNDVCTLCDYLKKFKRTKNLLTVESECMTDSPGDKFIQEQPLKALNVREAMNQQFNMTTVRPCVLMYCNCYITACA